MPALGVHPGGWIRRWCSQRETEMHAKKSFGLVSKGILEKSNYKREFSLKTINYNNEKVYNFYNQNIY